MKRCFIGLAMLPILWIFTPIPQAHSAEPGPLWTFQTPGDPPLTLISLPDVTGDGLPGLLAGYDSGLLRCLNLADRAAPEEIWSATLDGSILALLAVPDSDGDGLPEAFAATDLGQVARVATGGASAGHILWSFHSTCNVSALASLDDLDGDGENEIAAAGADQRVHLLSGKTGERFWSRFFDDGTGAGSSYVNEIANAGDLNHDGLADLFVRTWGGAKILYAIDGSTGEDLWEGHSGSGLTGVLAVAGDLNGDGLSDYLSGGNNGILYFRSGNGGSILWRCSLGRPLREVLVTGDVTGDGIADCFGATAGGVVACLSGAASGWTSPLWTSETGDVCRSILTPGDIDQDGKPDVVVASENGTVNAYSGASGQSLWQWVGSDVVRTLEPIADLDGDGVKEIAVGLLNGDLVLLSGASNVSGKMDRATPMHDSRLQSMTVQETAQDDIKVPILLYHDVLPEAFYSCCSLSTANFEAQMDVLIEGGFTAVSLDQIADWIEGTESLPEKPVCITFDGPYDGHHTWAARILQERGLFAISYITTDWIGTPNHLDWHQLRQLEDSGVMDIQNHTINHPNLTGLASDAVIQQVSGCTDAISRHLGGKVSRHHAYPGGAHNATVHQILRDIGVRTATTVESRKTVRTDNLMALPRYGVSRTTSIGSFKQMVGFVEPPLPGLPYEFVGTVGSNWRMPSFGDVDAEGKLWICDYSAGTVRIFLSDGSEAAFSPITHGLKQDGTRLLIAAPSGVAITPSGEAVITIADYLGTPQYFGLFRYRAADGEALTGIDLPFRPGDVDTDANGFVYLVNKVVYEWHVYSPDFIEIAGSPFGPGTQNHIQRGISVTPDASKVYVISETSRDVRVWKGNATIASANYTQVEALADNLSAGSGGVDVMDDGTVLVGYNEEGRIRSYGPDHRPRGDLSGGNPVLTLPRGTAFTPDGRVLWAISQSGFVQRWERLPSDGIANWATY